MSGLDATTPQLKAIKGFIDGYLTRDANNAEPFMSKAFKSQAFRKTPDVHDETKGGHFERYGMLMSMLNKAKVRIQQRGPPPRLRTDILHSQLTYHDVTEEPGKVAIQVCLSL